MKVISQTSYLLVSMRFDKRNLLYYYAAEKAVNHWDAVCSEYVNNTYVVFNGSMYLCTVWNG